MRKASLLCQEEYSYHADWQWRPKWPCTNQPIKITLIGNSLVVLVVHAFTSRALGSIPSQGTKISQTKQRGFKKKKKKNSKKMK